MEDDASARRDLARKINPAYAEGRLVRVATGRQQPEAEMIQGMLLEEGIPSTVKRSAGFDVPDMLAAGPRDILVAASGVAAARDVLLESELIDPDAAGAQVVQPQRLLLVLVAVVVLVAVILVVGSSLS